MIGSRRSNFAAMAFAFATIHEIPHQLAKIGVTPQDVSTIVLTHMHGDHIGGPSHFEHCKIFVSRSEYELAPGKKGPGNGYFLKNWPKWFRPTLIDYEEHPEGNFKKSFPITDDGAIKVVPTPGHSIGHQSILAKDSTFTYFIAGDLTYNCATLKREIPDVVLMNKVAQQTVEKVHRYVQSTPCIYLSSHDWNAVDLLEKKEVF